MTTTSDVIVVGAGLAGLTAGATAAAGGARTSVLETARPGGRARTAERAGAVLNHGPHALYRGGEALPILRRLGVAPRGAKPPLSRYRLRLGGQLHQMPSGLRSLLATGALGVRSKAQLSKVLGSLPLTDPASVAGVSVDDWVAGKDLRPDAEQVLRALVRIGTYADDTSTMSADAAVLQLRREAGKGVLYLHGGWAQLVDGLSSLVGVRQGAGVTSVRADGGRLLVTTAQDTIAARAVVVAAGSPAAAAGLLGTSGWGDLGGPVTGACLDLVVGRVPTPGYVLGGDEPLYATTQSPPARQAPDGCGVVAVIRYGATSAAEDRPLLEGWARLAGVTDDDVVDRRFLARLPVAATAPLARLGGLHGRPSVEAAGVPGAFLAGDWVGAEGLLADAAVASGHAAGLAALRAVALSGTMVA